MRRTLPRALLAGVVVGLMAEVSINPFDTAFRFSLGPVALAFIALFFMIPAYVPGIAAGLIVPLVHAVFEYAKAPYLTGAELLQAVSSYLPETVAYSALGLLLFVFRVRDRTRSPLQVAGLLAAADMLVNITELAVRSEPFLFRSVTMIALVAMGRAAVAAGAFYILHEGVRERQWEQERQSYLQRLLFTSNLQTEVFFLQKSAREIEQITAKAHRLYRDLPGNPCQPLALEIAKDIHEIKKDHQRTLSSLYELVDVPTFDPEMNFSEIVGLVLDVNQAYAATQKREITISARLAVDFRTSRFGRWVSILNNLVSNAVEACHLNGSVTVSSARQGDRLVLWVSDTGSGIPQEDWVLIFSPGFTTKLNPVTGAFSSGIGLTHVAGLVVAMQGSIQVERSGSWGTVFRLEVPWDSLEALLDEE